MEIKQIINANKPNNKPAVLGLGSDNNVYEYKYGKWSDGKYWGGWVLYTKDMYCDNHLEVQSPIDFSDKNNSEPHPLANPETVYYGNGGAILTK